MTTTTTTTTTAEPAHHTYLVMHRTQHCEALHSAYRYHATALCTVLPCQTAVALGRTARLGTGRLGGQGRLAAVGFFFSSKKPPHPTPSAAINVTMRTHLYRHRDIQKISLLFKVSSIKRLIRYVPVTKNENLLNI
jgi:hypothetical protein